MPEQAPSGPPRGLLGACRACYTFLAWGATAPGAVLPGLVATVPRRPAKTSLSPCHKRASNRAISSRMRSQSHCPGVNARSIFSGSPALLEPNCSSPFLAVEDWGPLCHYPLGAGCCPRPAGTRRCSSRTIATNPEHRLAHNAGVNEPANMADDRAPGAVTFLGEVAVADARHAIDGWRGGRILAPCGAGILSGRALAKGGNDRRSHSVYSPC